MSIVQTFIQNFTPSALRVNVLHTNNKTTSHIVRGSGAYIFIAKKASISVSSVSFVTGSHPHAAYTVSVRLSPIPNSGDFAAVYAAMPAVAPAPSKAPVPTPWTPVPTPWTPVPTPWTPAPTPWTPSPPICGSLGAGPPLDCMSAGFNTGGEDVATVCSELLGTPDSHGNYSGGAPNGWFAANFGGTGNDALARCQAIAQSTCVSCVSAGGSDETPNWTSTDAATTWA